MTTIQLREELIRLAHAEGNPDLLSLAVRLLSARSQDDVLRATMTARALRSNEDILAGRVMSKEELIRATDQTLRGK